MNACLFLGKFKQPCFFKSLTRLDGNAPVETDRLEQGVEVFRKKIALQ
jgi:hypothetical protein